MSRPLGTYLNDHLGGAQIAIQLLKAMRDQHDDPEYREFASGLLPEIEADDHVLRSFAEKIGSPREPLSKLLFLNVEAKAWVQFCISGIRLSPLVGFSCRRRVFSGLRAH